MSWDNSPCRLRRCLGFLFGSICDDDEAGAFGDEAGVGFVVGPAGADALSSRHDVEESEPERLRQLSHEMLPVSCELLPKELLSKELLSKERMSKELLAQLLVSHIMMQLFPRELPHQHGGWCRGCCYCCCWRSRCYRWHGSPSARQPHVVAAGIQAKRLHHNFAYTGRWLCHCKATRRAITAHATT